MAEIIVSGMRPWISLTALLGRLLEFLRNSFAVERDRWGLWIPVGMGSGIGLYFALTVEPPGWLGGVLAVGLGLAYAVSRYRPNERGGRAAVLALPMAIIAVGFALAQLQSWRVAAPVIQRDLGIVDVAGRITDIELQDSGERITLIPDRVGRSEVLPHYLRLKMRHVIEGLAIGDDIVMRADIMPPPGPALPGGFDFQRQAWFSGLGGVGYGVGDVSHAPSTQAGFGRFVTRVRIAMSDRIRTALPPRTGAIAAALITGERGAVPPDVNQDYRDSGLSHLLVIAGLHMTLVTGFVFFFVRGLLALVPSIALYYPIKKWAAAAALAIALCYLVISGSAIPTERAFVMVALGLLAILVDRAHVSMRGVAWAAGIVLLISPVALIGVSFQMSFSAVVGLVTFYETYGSRLALLRGGAGPIGRLGLMLGGIVLTTLVATLATAPFSIYHFDRFAVFSVLANLLAVPIAAFWVMPWALASCLLMPFGCEAVGLYPMGWGIGLIESVAHLTAQLPDAVLDIPAMPNWGLVTVALGGLWLAIWRTEWRWLGLAPIAIGVASIIVTRPPDLIVSADGRLSAIRQGTAYLLSSTTADKNDAESWARAAGGFARMAMPKPGAAIGPIRCDRLGCRWLSTAGAIAIDQSASAMAEDCADARLLITRWSPSRACRRHTMVVDYADFRRDGAAAFWIDSDITMQTANAVRGDRPWVAKVSRENPTAATHGRPVNSGAEVRPADPEP